MSRCATRLVTRRRCLVLALLRHRNVIPFRLRGQTGRAQAEFFCLTQSGHSEPSCSDWIAAGPLTDPRQFGYPVDTVLADEAIEASPSSSRRRF